MNRRLALAVAAVSAVALVGAGCGSDKNTTSSSPTTSGADQGGAAGAKDSATLSGAGSSFVSPILQEWRKQYQGVAPGVTINYQPVGSGAGIQQLIAKTVDFAGSDVPLKPDEQQSTGGPGAVVELPWIAGGVAVEYNLPSVNDLKLSADTVAGIFTGKITKWNDAAIKADNPGASLPDTGITVVHRSDGSGTTAVFTEYLKAAAPGAWTLGSGKEVAWPTGTGAKGSDGVTAQVKQSEGSIGYSEVSYPKQASLGTALIKNKAGKFVGPTADAVTAALAGAKVKQDMTLDINYTPDDPAAYPISTTTYVMFYKSADPTKVTALKHFVEWVLTGGQKFASKLDYAPLPGSILQPALEAVKV